MMNEDIKATEAEEVIETVVNDVETEEEVGNIKISTDVISTIAGVAAAEINGVRCMYSTFAGGIAEMFGSKKSAGKGVKVEMEDSGVVIDLYIVVDYGVRIPELAWEIQENVKNNVETMTGMSVEKVNIHVEGVSFEKEADQSEESVGTVPQIEEEPGIITD